MPVLDTVLSQLHQLTPYTPGKPVEEVERELGISNAIKLASNENPLGYSTMARAAIEKALSSVEFYPDANAFYLKQALAEKLSVNASQITIGNGSNDVLDIIARSFVEKGRQVVFSEYAFLVYPLVTTACGGEAIVTPALGRDTNQPYGHDLQAMLSAISDKTALIFIANPNNPTGTWLDHDELLDFLQQVPSNVVVVIDEAYFEYVDKPEYPDSTRWLNQFPNLVVTRTFSKIYGLAGLRLGYSICSKEMADFFNRIRQPFNANSLALTAALQSLKDDDFVSGSQRNNQQRLSDMVDYCQNRGLFYIPSAGNFLSIEFPDRAMDIYQQLMQKGVIVRPIANYGLGDFLRITMGTESQMQQLKHALDQIL